MDGCFGGKAGKGAVKRGPVKKRRTEEDAYYSDLDEDQPLAARSGPAMDSPVQRHCGGAAAAGPPAPAAGGAATAGPPAPAAATRQTERTARDNEALERVLRTEKQKLLMVIEEDKKTIEGLREQLSAAKAALECHKGNRFALENCTAPELTELENEAFNLARSCAEVQYGRLQVMVNEEYKQKKQKDSEFLKITQCSICYEVFTDPVGIRCGHTFCKNCAITALTRKIECPLCKTQGIHAGETHPNWVLREMISARSTMLKTDHEAERRKKYAAEHAALRMFTDKRYTTLCAHMDTMAKEALKRM